MPQWIRLNRLTDEGIKKVRGGSLELFTDVKEAIEKEEGQSFIDNLMFTNFVVQR